MTKKQDEELLKVLKEVRDALLKLQPIVVSPLYIPTPIYVPYVQPYVQPYVGPYVNPWGTGTFICTAQGGSSQANQ
jgi:hypothetical protein